MLITTKALVIHSLRYGDADLIVQCYTESSGLKSYMLRRILKSKKGKLKASMFQPLTQLEIVANHKNKNTLEYMREAKVVQPYETIPSDMNKTSMVMFLAEVLRNAIQEEEPNPRLFQFLEESFFALDKEKSASNFHLLFLLKLTRFLGFYPDEFSFGRYFNLLEGVFQTEENDRYCLENPQTELLRKLLKLDFSEVTNLSLNKQRRNAFLDFMLLYYEIHLHGFHKPKSLGILQQLF